MADELLSIDADELNALMNRVISRTKDIDFTWEWPCGVAFYGMVRAWEILGNDEDLDYLVHWIDHYVDLGIPPFMVNTVSMGHTLLSLYEATGEERFLDLARQKAEYLEKDARRFDDGVLQHTVSDRDDFPGQAWADTLFMAAYFLLRMGRLLDNESYIQDALFQFLRHEELLQDESTNLFYHGYDSATGGHMSGVFWGRANAWAAYTMARTRRYVNYHYPEFMAINDSLRDQLSALVRLQSPKGLWHTVLDDEATYEETSASAGIAAAMVEYGNPLHREAVVRAYRGIVERIDPDGSVRGVSAGTAVMKTHQDYNRVPSKRVQGWGQGLTLAFLASLAEYRSQAGTS